jgi:hypothetical protein
MINKIVLINLNFKVTNNKNLFIHQTDTMFNIFLDGDNLILKTTILLSVKI